VLESSIMMTLALVSIHPDFCACCASAGTLTESVYFLSLDIELEWEWGSCFMPDLDSA
jgi:hypothetical protein